MHFAGFSPAALAFANFGDNSAKALYESARELELELLNESSKIDEKFAMFDQRLDELIQTIKTNLPSIVDMKK